MSRTQMLINNLKAFLSTVHVVSNENCLKTIVEESAKTCFTIFTNFDYPYLKNKKCDLRLVDKDTIFWIELKDNITLLPIGSSRIIYEMNKLVFLDIARLLVGVNNRYDHRLIIANISKAFIDDYYGINPQQIMKGSFTAEDVLPVSADRRKFVELKIEASIEMHFLQFSGGYLIVAQILDGFVNTNIYKNLDSRGSEGECKKKTYVDGDDVNKQYFFQEYFPSS